MRLYGIVTGLYNSRVVPLGRPRTARLRATGGIGRRVAPAGTEDWPLSTGARVAAAGGLCRFAAEDGEKRVGEGINDDMNSP